MTVPDGFTVNLVAAEPLVRQPVCIEFDDRGRLWVIQYLQYPNPAGLKRVKVDRFSRTIYDQVPEPPPLGPKGADKITILEDTDDDGRMDKAKDFVTGLNLASGMAFGHGGVFVLQVPYLLFYPDRDGDDVPDGDPDVLLTGFGMEDAHSVANSLTWGPDGWLYGCQGSTVTAHIRGVEFQQGVWRYHPIAHRFELFCEGGGNSWGLDFDRHGELLYSTNVGGFVMLHGVQGAYLWKQFGKHGALHNPYSYGYFDHVPHTGFKGGHVTVGGLFYQGDSFPERFRGKYIGADLLGHGVYWHDVQPNGSTFRSHHGGDLLTANDTWFAPTDMTLGPDGAVYVADWQDQRTAHPDPDAEWDRSNGRIYRIQASGGRKPPVNDSATGGLRPPLAERSSRELVDLLAHSNQWYVRKARRLLADRRDTEVIFALRTRVLESQDDRAALEALWTLHVCGGFTEGFATESLKHRSPHVRRWVVRLLGDDSRVSREMAQRLAEMAKTEPDVSIRAQLACTARRLPAPDVLPIIAGLLKHHRDARDTHVPLLLWWALEEHALTSLPLIVERFTTAETWKQNLSRDFVLPRLVRRLAVAKRTDADEACAQFLESAPTPALRESLLLALEQGWRDRPGGVGPDDVAKRLRQLLNTLSQADASNVTLLRLMTRLGFADALKRTISLATDSRSSPALRLSLLELLTETGDPSCITVIGKLVGDAEPENIQLAALTLLQRFDRDEVRDTLVRLYPLLKGRLKSRCAEGLLSRQRWAIGFLTRIDSGEWSAKDVSVDLLRPLAAFQNKDLDALVRKHWGTIAGGTPEERLAEVRRLNNDLRAGSGNPVAGKTLFTKHCAACHRLFDEGEPIGPDLTHANRKDRDYLLVSLVDPSAVVRKEFLSYQVVTLDGRTLTGLIAAQEGNRLTLVNARNEKTLLQRDQIDSLQESPVSLMPENLLKDLKPEELRDLFSYLQKEGR